MTYMCIRAYSLKVLYIYQADVRVQIRDHTVLLILKSRSRTVFTADAVSRHVDLKSLEGTQLYERCS